MLRYVNVILIYVYFVLQRHICLSLSGSKNVKKLHKRSRLQTNFIGYVSAKSCQ